MRPLTVADRQPELWDDLSSGGAGIYRVERIRSGIAQMARLTQIADGLLVYDDNARAMPLDQIDNWVYLRRRDGGPVTVEEDAATHSPPPQ